MTRKQVHQNVIARKAMQKAHENLYGYTSDTDLWDVLDKNTLTRYKNLSHKEAVYLQQKLGDAVIIHDQF